jgi:predicted trehalose synthase
MPKKVLESIVEPLVEEEPIIADIPDSEPEEEPKSIQKSKKPRTQAQIDAFAKVILKRTENRKMRADKREQDAIVVKAELEKKILKKASSIKKRQIKHQVALDDISSDDESDTEVKKKLSQFKRSVVEKVMKTVVPAVPVPVVPKYVFV